MPRTRDDDTKTRLRCLLETRKDDFLKHLCSPSSRFWSDLVHTAHLKMTPKAFYTFARKELAGVLQHETKSLIETEESCSVRVFGED